MPTATAVSFFIPRTPVIQSRDKRWTPYRHQQWGMWVSALRLWGQGIGPIKTPIDYPIRIRATVRWPRNGVEIDEHRPGQWAIGVKDGLVRAKFVAADLIKRVEVGWELVDVDKCGTFFEIEPMEEHSDV